MARDRSPYYPKDRVVVLDHLMAELVDALCEMNDDRAHVTSVVPAQNAPRTTLNLVVSGHNFTLRLEATD